MEISREKFSKTAAKIVADMPMKKAEDLDDPKVGLLMTLITAQFCSRLECALFEEEEK